MPLHIATIRAELTGAPSYRIASSGGTEYVILGMGALHITCGDPGELRRLADVAANAADVLEQAQASVRQASRCCDQATHDALRNTDGWYDLDLVGFQSDGADGWLTLRNCQCGATLARPIVRSEERERLSRAAAGGGLAVVP